MVIATIADSLILDLETTPRMEELDCYIIAMAPFYKEIGLELSIGNAKLIIIESEPSLSDLTKKCRRMLDVWLQSDTTATWKKLCDALEEKGIAALAHQIRNTILLKKRK